jgi:hypothetical protein
MNGVETRRSAISQLDTDRQDDEIGQSDGIAEPSQVFRRANQLDERPDARVLMIFNCLRATKVCRRVCENRRRTRLGRSASSDSIAMENVSQVTSPLRSALRLIVYGRRERERDASEHGIETEH